jgi:hypothetical protein
MTLVILALLGLLAYLPLFAQPLVEDDYPNIQIASAAGVHIVSNPIFAVRSTGFLLMSAIHAMFGMNAIAYYAAMILLHILNTWLVYAIGSWRAIGYKVSLWAAACFAVAERHQEAVMWLSADWEQMQFLFGAGSFVLWLLFLYRERWVWLAASVAAFAAALDSKESAVILLPLMALPLLFDGALRKRWLALAPFVFAVALDIMRIARTRAYSFRFNDGSFSLHAPFWLIWPANFGRLFWFWGILAVIALFVWKPPRYGKVLAMGLLWAGVSLAPYSFLTYSTRIPSRQTYLASLGVALIIGCAFQALMETNRRRWVAAAVATVFVVHNVGYLWTKKRVDFLKRAAPTEQLIELARTTGGPIYVRCFPRPPIVADAAVELTTGRKDLIWNAEQSGAAKATFCYQ